MEDEIIMDYKSFVWSVMIFAGVFAAGSLLFTSLAVNYPEATNAVPGSLDEFSQEAQNTLYKLNETARYQFNKTQEFQSGDILGVVTAVLSVPSLLYSVMKAVLFEVPSYMLGLISGNMGGIVLPGILTTLAFTAIFLFIVFEFISIIFKR